MTVYACYLFFQLFSHKALYEDDSPDVMKSTAMAPHRSWKEVKKDRAEKKAKKNGTWIAPTDAEIQARNQEVDEANLAELRAAEEEEEEIPQMGLFTTIGLLVAVTVVSI